MRPIHVAGLLLLASIWGASFMFIKIMVDEMEPLAVGWVRLGGGSMLIVTVVVATGRRLSRSRTYWLNVCVISVISSAAPLVLIATAQREIASGLAAMLNGAMPLWVAIFSTIFLPLERLTRMKLVGLALGFAGLAVIIGPDAFDLSSGSTRAQFLVVLATTGYAGGAVFTRRRLMGVDPTTLAAAQNVVAFALLTPFVVGAGAVPNFPDLEGRTLLAAAGLAFLGQGVAIMIYYWLLSNVEATRVSVVTYLAPIAALFWGWAVLDEIPPLMAIPGLTLIIAGIIIVNRRSRTALVTEEPSIPRPSGGGT